MTHFRKMQVRSARFRGLVFAGALLLGAAALIVYRIWVLPEGLPRQAGSVGLAVFGFLLILWAKHQLRCPLCEKSLPRTTVLVCPHCGQGLSEESRPLPVSGLRQADARSKLAARMAVFPVLARWRWRFVVLAAGISLGFTAYVYRDGLSGQWWKPVLLYSICNLLLWAVLVHAPFGLLHALFWTQRARCPNCEAPFSGEVKGAVGTHVIVDLSVPDFCAQCGCRFAGNDGLS